ncbi:hypothetical protein CJD36_016800 [Flavipsychrobacter stenotrophus]|uniref:Uncharacterized protein n=1 Tax=Flavipsychrobacter stenotrophus TaxID=2077091 RepID=A0A2S7SSA6_9BACT|nr:hypothetical protein [Flavipsychrobacter stenotrophus]PQJ09598.1 hypothetical protein CJD36_016800 [Flavipsychrobacter stenotrophus]
MSTKDYNDYQAVAALGLLPDNENPLFLFNSTSKELLLDIVNGRLDPVQMARLELMNRGLDTETGNWIGWPKKSMEDVFK